MFTSENIWYTSLIFHYKGGKYMATKKAASSARKSTAKKPTASKQTSTKVTTVKAVESRPVAQAVTSAPGVKSKLSFNRRPLLAALIAEFVGTFIFAATVIAGQGQPILVFFALTGVVLAVGTLSGAYVNPALTVAAWVTRRMSAMRALGYVVAQLLGAMLALVVLNAYVGQSAAPSAADMYSGAAAAELFKATALPEGKEWMVLVAEMLGTAILGFAVANATREKNERSAAALTVGLGVFGGLMVAGSATALVGGSAILNPAVAVALQVNFAGVWTIAVYMLGSALGAVLGFALYDFLRNTEKELE